MKNPDLKPNLETLSSPKPYPTKKIILFNFIIILFIISSFEIYLRLDKRFDYLKTDHQFILGKEIHLNSSGFRDDEFINVVKRDGSQTFIFAAGDSTTFGSGVSWRNVYAKRLQAILNNNQPEKDYFVFNGGGQGNALEVVLKQINELKLDRFPKMLIVGISPSHKAFKLTLQNTTDFKDTSSLDTLFRNLKWNIEDKFLSLHVWLHHNTRIYSIIDQEIRARLFKMGLLKERLDKINGAMIAYAFQIEEIDETFYNLILQSYDNIEKKISSLNEKTNSKLILFGIPSRFMISDHAIDNLRSVDKNKIRIDPMDKIRLISKKHGIIYADLKKRLIQERANMFSNKIEWDDLYIRNDYSHLNARGHELAAEVLFKTIQTNGLLSPN